MTLGRGMRNDWTPRHEAATASQATRTATNTTTRRAASPRSRRLAVAAGPSASVTRGPRRGCGRARSSSARPSAASCWRSASRTSVTSCEVALGLARLDRSLGAAGRCRRPARSGPGRADMTTTRVDRKTASGMVWVTNTIVVPVRRQMFMSSTFIRSRVISSSAPNGSSISSSFGSNDERPGDRHALLHAARQLPRMAVGERLELDEVAAGPRRGGVARRPGSP